MKDFVRGSNVTPGEVLYPYLHISAASSNAPIAVFRSEGYSNRWYLLYKCCLSNFFFNKIESERRLLLLDFYKNNFLSHLLSTSLFQSFWTQYRRRLSRWIIFNISPRLQARFVNSRFFPPRLLFVNTLRKQGDIYFLGILHVSCIWFFYLVVGPYLSGKKDFKLLAARKFFNSYLIHSCSKKFCRLRQSFCCPFSRKILL